MHCPLCKTSTMSAVELSVGLSGQTCGDCSGVWVARSDYDAWRAKRSGASEETVSDAEFVVADTHKAKVCAQCGHLLLPYRVGHGLSFSIDYCGACGGVWFDRNEWDAIKAKKLHDNLHDIVSAHWQAAVLRTSVQEAVEQTHKRHLGEAYGKASEVRSWLREQPQKSLILAYLSEW